MYHVTSAAALCEAATLAGLAVLAACAQLAAEASLAAAIAAAVAWKTAPLNKDVLLSLDPRCGDKPYESPEHCAGERCKDRRKKSCHFFLPACCVDIDI